MQTSAPSTRAAWHRTTVRSKASQVDLLVALPHLGPGGAQRVASLLLNYWRRHGTRIVVVTLFAKPDAYYLDAGIQRCEYVSGDDATDARGLLVSLYVRLFEALERMCERHPVAAPTIALALAPLRLLRKVRTRVLAYLAKKRPGRQTRRARWLREQLQQWRPRAVISFLGATNIQALMAARGLDIPVVISERNDPALQNLDEPWETLRPRVYPEATIVTANSAGALKTMSMYVPPPKLRQVANPLVVPSAPEGVLLHGSRLIFVARLVHQKAPEVLLQAFALVAPEFPEWTLDIVGDGPMRGSLEDQAEALGIGYRTVFHGHARDPYPLLFQASVFVLPSRFEGMPNAMLEAMGCGLAIIVSDASPGPLELIRNDETGLVTPVEDVAALSAALRRLLGSSTVRERLAVAAMAEVDKMRLEHVAADWEAILSELGVSLRQKESEASLR